MRYVWDGGRWAEVSRETFPRLTPYLISDHMEPLRHMATGQLFDSKSAFRAATRAAGCVELGNDATPPPKPFMPVANLREDIAESIRKVEQGHRVESRPAEGEIRTYT